ncbi:MAG: hypothetical protein GF388_08955, partial [Candidatus Aegiribacteria sp.]|nr:hypothetical protein [Candidatus Aegiribacteria sp.]
MKAYRHFAVSVTGRIHLNEFTGRMAQRHPDVSIADRQLQDSIRCKVFRRMSKGTLHFEECNANFQIDLYAFERGIFMFEIAIKADILPEKVLEKDFITEKVSITTAAGRSEDPLMMHAWMFLFNLLDFEEVISKVGEVGSFSEEGQRETHDAILDTSLIDSFYLGEQCYFQTVRGICDKAIVISGPAETASVESAEPVYDKKSQVHKLNNVFHMSQEDQEYLDLYRFLLYRRNLMDLFSKIMTDWLESVSEQAILIRNNLEETNKVYWSRLKRRLEMWDLNFLEIFSKVNSAINVLESVRTDDLQSPYSRGVEEEYNKSRQLVFKNMDSLKYSIANLRTPCETHDEDLLQKETEKVNERIMLLSFLAMSIPLLGAILAPGISTETKLVAAVILFSLPTTYI